MFWHRPWCIEVAEDEHKRHQIPILLQEGLWVPKHLVELLYKLLLGMERDKPLGLLAKFRVVRAAVDASHDLAPHHLSVLAVVWAGFQIAADEPSAISPDKLLQLGQDFLG